MFFDRESMSVFSSGDAVSIDQPIDRDENQDKEIVRAIAAYKEKVAKSREASQDKFGDAERYEQRNEILNSVFPFFNGK